MSKKYSVTLLSKNSGAYMHSADHNYIYLKCLVDHKKFIKRIFDDEYHIIDVDLIIDYNDTRNNGKDPDDLTLEGQKYQCYIDNTQEAFPKTFEEWLNT